MCSHPSSMQILKKCVESFALLIVVSPSTLPKTLKGQDKKEEKRLDTCTQDGHFCDHAGNDSAPAHKLTTME